MRRRRRRNPERVSFNTIFNVVLIGGAAYVFYKYILPILQAPAKIPQIASSASSTVADWAEKLFPHGNTVLDPNASIMLDDASIIPASAPSGVGSFTDVDNVVKIQFYYNGKTYRTLSAQPDDANMYYAAVAYG